MPSFGAEDFSVTLSGVGSGSTFSTNAGVVFSSRIGGLGLYSGLGYLDTD